MIKERDRQLSEDKLLDTVGELITEVGFEKLGINQVAQRAGFSKNLIYRYFGSLDGLIYAYMKKHDFWVNARDEMPDMRDLKAYLKDFYRREIDELRRNVALKRLRRWELSADNKIVAEIRAQREKNGVRFLDMMSELVGIDRDKVQAVSTLIDAGIGHLTLLEDNCPVYNGIDIQSTTGWLQIAGGIDWLIDIMLNESGYGN